MIGNTIVAAPDHLRDSLRKMTRMQLIRTLAAGRPDMGGCREMETACRTALRSLAGRHLGLQDEVCDLDAMITSIVDERAPDRVARNSIGYGSAAQLLVVVSRKL